MKLSILVFYIVAQHAVRAQLQFPNLGFKLPVASSLQPTLTSSDSYVMDQGQQTSERILEQFFSLSQAQENPVPSFIQPFDSSLNFTTILNQLTLPAVIRSSLQSALEQLQKTLHTTTAQGLESLEKGFAKLNEAALSVANVAKNAAATKQVLVTLRIALINTTRRCDNAFAIMFQSTVR